MKSSGTKDSRVTKPRLVCPQCGYDKRFIEVMAEEAHLVDGDCNYIKLLEGIVDQYLCLECGTAFDVEECTNS